MRGSRIGARRQDDPELVRTPLFRSKFWLIWSTTFAFAPWHSAVEFKRYCLRFLHLFSTIDTFAGIYRTQLNQFDAMVRPTVAWLTARGVRLEMGTEVTDVDIVAEGGTKTATRLRYRHCGEDRAIDLAERDLVFVTNGPMTSDTSYGSMDTVPVLNTERTGGRGNFGSAWLPRVRISATPPPSLPRSVSPNGNRSQSPRTTRASSTG